MMLRREQIPNILLGGGVVAALAGVVWWVVQGMTIYSNLLLIGAALCVAMALYLKPVQTLAGTRQVQYGGNVAMMVVLLIAILTLVNMILNPDFPRPGWLDWLPTFEKRWDLTTTGQYSLSKETRDILQRVNQPVEILAFYSSQSSEYRREDRLLLEEYTRHTPWLTLRWIDPVMQPTLAQKYGVTYDGTVILQVGERRQEVSLVKEVNLTSALLKVLRTGQPVVYFTTGHGERSLEDYGEKGYSQAKSALELSGYQVRPLATMMTPTIPADAAAIVIAGPTGGFTADEAERIRAYLAHGGKVMLMLDVLDPQQHPDTLLGLGAVLDEWGVSVPNAVVVDAGQSLASSLERVYVAPVVARYGYSPITNKLNGVTVFMVTRPITQTRSIENIQYTALAQSSADSWQVSDLTEVENALNMHRAPQPGEGDERGPLTLAASLENTQTQGRLVVFGGSAFASNMWITSGVGRDFFLNAVNWLSAQSVEEFTLPPKESTVQPMQPLTLDQLLVAGLVNICLLPLAVAAAGVWVWWRRR